MKTILLTGTTGFVGSHVLEQAHARFPEDRLVLLTSRPVDGECCVLHRQFTFTADDFRAQGIDTVDAVIHAGAFNPHNKQEGADALRHVDSVTSTRRILENLPSVPAVFTYVSTMDVYGDNADGITEETPVSPRNIYAAGKLLAEYLVQDWCRRNGCLSHVIRLGHIYGPRDPREYLFTFMLKQAAAGQPLKLFANPQTPRNCVFVDDCAACLLNSLDCTEPGIINLVADQTATLGDIVRIIADCPSPAVSVELAPQAAALPANGLRFANNDRCRQFLGGLHTSLADGLRAEYRYYHG